MVFRIVYFFILLLSILFLPFWLSVVFAIFGMIYFSIFWEAVPLFILSDLLFGTYEGGNSLVIFALFFISTIFLILIEMLKRKLKFYPRVLIK